MDLEFKIGSLPVRAFLAGKKAHGTREVQGLNNEPYRALRLEAFSGLILVAFWTGVLVFR